MELTEVVVGQHLDRFGAFIWHLKQIRMVLIRHNITHTVPIFMMEDHDQILLRICLVSEIEYLKLSTVCVSYLPSHLPVSSHQLYYSHPTVSCRTLINT